MSEKTHAIALTFIFIFSAIAAGAGYYFGHEYFMKNSAPSPDNVKVPQKDPHYFACAAAVKFKDGGTAWINNFAVGRPESVMYQGREISALYVYPVLYFTYKGQLSSASATVYINISVGHSSSQPVDSFIMYPHMYVIHASSSGLSAKDGKATWHLGTLELKESQIQQIVAATLGSSYSGPIYLRFIVSVHVSATFADGNHDSKNYAGSGVLSGFSVSPDGKLETGSVMVKFNWQETDAAGGGGNPNAPVRAYDILG